MLPILPLGDPRLRRPSEPLASNDGELRRHLTDLGSALTAFRSSHGWGRAIALPQLGIAKRVLAFDLGAGPFFVINPIVEWVSPETFEVWDDCMCLPEIAVRVRRHRSLTLTFLDESLRPSRMERVSEDISELIQHEVDHLEGVLLTDRMLPEWGVVARAARALAVPIAAGPSGAAR